MTTFAPDADPRAFRDALGRFATGVTLVTIARPKARWGSPPTALPRVAGPAAGAVVAGQIVAAGSTVMPRRGIMHSCADGRSGDWLPRFARGGAGFDGLPMR
jgi:hypothetical protein